MSKLLVGHRDASISFRRYKRFNNMPTEIDPSKRAEVIAVLEAAIKDILLDLKDVQQVFLDWEKSRLQTDSVPTEDTADQIKQTIEVPQALWNVTKVVFKRFDLLVNVEKGTIVRFKAEIAALENGIKIFWDKKKQAEEAAFAREELIKELVAVERQKCAAINCPCIKREQEINAKEEGAGTVIRLANDLKNAEEVVDGKEVWKEGKAMERKVSKEYFEEKQSKTDEVCLCPA
jgi:hypothetical protein